MRSDINVRKLNLLELRGEDLLALVIGAQERHKSLSASVKYMRERLTADAEGMYQEHVSGLSVDEMLKLTPAQQQGLRVNLDDVHALVDTIARRDQARAKCREVDADATDYGNFIYGLRTFAAGVTK